MKAVSGHSYEEHIRDCLHIHLDIGKAGLVPDETRIRFGGGGHAPFVLHKWKSMRAQRRHVSLVLNDGCVHKAQGGRIYGVCREARVMVPH